CSLPRRPPRSPRFPYTTLFRSLPPDRVLAPRLAVPRATVRRAVEELVRLGRLERRHGAGAFVAPPKPDQGLTTGSFAVDVRRRGDRKSTRLNSSHVKISYAVFC